MSHPARRPDDEPSAATLRLDRTFPGLTLGLPEVLGTKIGRLVADQFEDPARLAKLGEIRFIRFAAVRGLKVQARVGARLVSAARDALSCPDAAVDRPVLAMDPVLLTQLHEQITAAEAAMAELLPASPFATLTTVPDGVWPGPATTSPR